MKEESKGWCQFVEEEWLPKTDLTEETQQRRALIERWASADQAFRDICHPYSAPLRNSPLDYPPHLLSKTELDVKRFFCLASVDKEHDTDNYKRLLKLLILLYLHENGGCAHPRGGFNDWEDPQLPYILVDSSTTTDFTEFFSHRNLLSNVYLQTAEFRAVSMTRSGTVIFPGEIGDIEYMVINLESLNEGRVALMTFKPNGELQYYAMLLPWNASRIMSKRWGLFWGFNELLDPEAESSSDPFYNKPLNMDEPLLAIVNCAMQRKDLNHGRYRLSLWEREIEKFAPGYLALERQGRAIDFDLANLWTEALESYSHPPPPQTSLFQSVQRL